MQVTLLVVGLIVGFALGLGAGWFLWHPSRTGEEKRPERSERRPARYPRSYEPSTPPQHRPTPRPRPVTALHHPNPVSSGTDDMRPVEPAPSRSSDPTRQPVEVSQPVPAPEITFASSAVSARAATADAEPLDRYEYRPTPRTERAVSIDQPQAADRHLLNDLLETNRRLTEDAELRLRREGAPGVEQLDLAERAPKPPPSSVPEPNDLLARHRKLEEDSRRMGRRPDER